MALTDKLKNIADAIRTKTGKAEGLTLDAMPNEILSISGSEPHFKIYYVTVPTAVAATDVTVVTGDADVANHYKDANAMVVVRKITNNNTNGTAIIVQTNHLYPQVSGVYLNFNTANNASSTIAAEILGLDFDGETQATPYVKCNASGDIIVHGQRQQNNFGGADYIITFSW